MKIPSAKSLTLMALVPLLLAPAEAGPFSRFLATPHDAVTTPGQAVNVEAKFERKGFYFFNPDLRNEPVRFDFGSGVTANASTDRDGLAAIGIRAGLGVYPFSAELSARSNAPTADGRLFVLDPATPVAIVDIDHTLSDLSTWRVPFQGADAPTFPDAPQLINDLARTHQIIYLTARDDSFDAISRAFLARHGFPDGPVIYNDLGATTWAELEQLDEGKHGEFKLAAIQGLQARGVNVVLGIGDKPTDAFAYETSGIQSYIHTTQAGSSNSYRFTDYPQLRLELVARGVLP